MTTYKIQTVYTTSGEVERVIEDNLTFEQADMLFFNTRSGLEVEVQIVQVEPMGLGEHQRVIKSK